MNEYIIENLTTLEIDLINNSPDVNSINWYPDDPFDADNTDIVIEGTTDDVKTILAIIGRGKE